MVLGQKLEPLSQAVNYTGPIGNYAAQRSVPMAFSYRVSLMSFIIGVHCAFQELWESLIRGHE